MINVVCAVLQDSEGRFLVCQRPADKALAGQWEFPGGKVEHGENAREALQREVIEELGCLVKVGESLPAVEHQYPDFSIRLIPFRCMLENGTPQALEHSALKWLTATELPALDWAEADLPIWQNLLSK